MVGVDGPMKAPSMHIQKLSLEKIVKVLTTVILSINIFLDQTASCICSMCLHCIGKVSNCSIKTVVEVDRPMKAPSMHKLLHAYVQCVYIV